MSEFFRAGVGALIVDARGSVLAFERSDVPGAWQLPQGGMDAGEDARTAVLREVEEETGLSPSALTLVAEHPVLLGYELPVPLRSKKTGRGQCHRWFLFRYDGDAEIDPASGGEFRSYGWLRMKDLVARTVDFRRPVYEELERYFAKQLR